MAVIDGKAVKEGKEVSKMVGGSFMERWIDAKVGLFVFSRPFERWSLFEDHAPRRLTHDVQLGPNFKAFLGASTQFHFD